MNNSSDNEFDGNNKTKKWKRIKKKSLNKKKCTNVHTPSTLRPLFVTISKEFRTERN